MEEMNAELLQLKAAFERFLDKVELSKHVAVAAMSRDPSQPSTTLMHVRFLEDNADIDKLANFLWACAQNYSLSRRRRQELRAQMEEAPEGDLSVVAKIATAVRNAFLEFNSAYPNRSSEVGELLAYCIAIEQLGATQLLAKMALKTNNNMPVHGLDGIHGKVENGGVTVYFLESKLSKSANSGAKEFAESVAEFTNNKKQYQREYQLVRDLGNLDSLSPSDKEVALEYFDIFNSSDRIRRERYVGVILYSDQRAFDNLPQVNDRQEAGFHEKAFAVSYAKKLRRHQNAALKHLMAKRGKAEKCRVFFVAVPDAGILRERLYEAMGYTPSKSATNKTPSKKKVTTLKVEPGVKQTPRVKKSSSARKSADENGKRKL